jgi:hypothetical protein
MNDGQRTTIKSFWDRDEGYTGMFFIGMGLLTGGYLLYHWLPTIIKLLENTLYAGFLFGIIGFLVFFVVNERTRTLFRYIFQSFCRKITGVFVAVDPIGILKTYIRDLKDSMEAMDTQIQNLRGQMGALRNIIQKNDTQIKDCLNKASFAKEKNQQQVLLQSRQAGRLQKSNTTFIEIFKKMDLLYQLLTKMRQTSDTLLKDMENEVGAQIQQYQMSNAAYAALGQAMKILKGGGAGRELYDEAMERMEVEYGTKMGEIEHFMEVSRSFIEGVDLENAAYEEKAMQMLNDWEQKGGTLLGEDKQLLLSNLESTSLDFSAMTELEPVPFNFT